MAGKSRKKNSTRDTRLILFSSTLLIFLALSAAVLLVRPHPASASTASEATSVSALGTRGDPGDSAAIPNAVPGPTSPGATDAQGMPPGAIRPPAAVQTVLPGAADPQSIQDALPSPLASRDMPKTRIRPKPSRGTLIFIIDDAGHNLWQLEPFLKIKGALTIAVLPGVPYTVAAASMVRGAGKELILHQPMEALNDLDPGPNAISLNMGAAEIRNIIRSNLALVPGAVGINNHMGSKATSDVRTMTVVLDEAHRKGIYFLDSLTIGDSVVHSVATLLKLSAWERTVFLDNTPDRASILAQLAEGTKIAEKRGYAIMIGHVWSAELAQTLTDIFPQLIEQGFSLSTISRMIMEKDDADSWH